MSADNGSDKPKIIWITGASQGIGEALALLTASQGMTVIASARSREKLEQLSARAENLSGEIIPKPLDILDRLSVENTIKSIVENHGDIDLAVLNAGTFIPMDGKEFRADTVKQHLDLNVMGTSYCLEPLIEIMKGQGSGQIAINASLSGYRGLPTAAAYGASKAALINMAECLHLELKSSGVDVRLINPGFVKTPLTDKNTFHMPFLVSSEQAAKNILKGLNGSGFEIRFPTAFAGIMGLLRVMPYRLYFYLAGKQLN
ncbi:oxidoreductase [Endozoicomonas sp. OPT23]|uniref:SDR family NAD(P)-dependent oxidoreductase n=1 Tax=Endozoicomonas sp. OPT23 TaxID=2072845 RepID=UPI001D4198E1|nr:oxidoreductase [Endozoicomonas sp. OPT23]